MPGNIPLFMVRERKHINSSVSIEFVINHFSYIYMAIQITIYYNHETGVQWIGVSEKWIYPELWLFF